MKQQQHKSYFGQQINHEWNYSGENYNKNYSSQNLNGRSGLKWNPVWHDGLSILPIRKSEQKKCDNWYHNTNTFYIVSNIIECDNSEIYNSHTYIYMILDKDCPQYVARNLRASNFIYSLDKIRCAIDHKGSNYLFLIKIHSTQCWTATATHIDGG